MSPRLSDSLYQPIPQAPDNPAADPEESQDDATLSLAADLPPEVAIDSRIRWIHFVLGCAVLLPWNVMITATPFFLSRLNSSLSLAFGSYLACSFTASNFVFLAFATVSSKQSSPSRRVLTTTLCLSALTFLLTISTFLRTSSGVFFAFVLLNGIAQAGLGAYLQTAIIVIASLFGPGAVQALMAGQAAVAVAVSGVQVLSALASVGDQMPLASAAPPSDGSAEARSALIFFSLSTVFLIVTAAAHAWLVSMPAYKTIAGSLEQRAKSAAGTPDERRGLVSRGRDEVSDVRRQIIRVAKANVIYEVAVAYVFVVTLAVFPAITISIQPVSPTAHPLLFSAVHFLIFNIGDFGGRYICSFPRLLIWSAKRLLALSAARTLFIPLFLMCNLQRPSSEAGAPSSALISSDFLFLLLLCVFGMSNGYLSSLCMMAAPSLEHNPQLEGRREDVDVAATVGSFCLVGGLALGSICSFAVRAAVCECNPFTTP